MDARRGDDIATFATNIEARAQLLCAVANGRSFIEVGQSKKQVTAPAARYRFDGRRKSGHLLFERP